MPAVGKQGQNREEMESVVTSRRTLGRKPHSRARVESEAQ